MSALAALLLLLPPQEDWKDTHRVILRNGNFIDGQLGEQTAETVIMKYSPTAQIRIDVKDIAKDGEGRLMIVPLRMRHISEPPPKPTGKAPDPAREATAPPAPTPSKVPAEIRRNVEEIIASFKVEKDKQPLIDRLAKAGPAHLSYAAELVGREDSEVAGWILAALNKAKDKSVIPSLKTHLAHRDPSTVIGTINALKLLDAKGLVGDVRPLLQHPAPEVRGAAVDFVGALGPREAVDALAPIVVDDVKQVRTAAARMIVQCARRNQAEQNAFQALKTALGRGKPENREMVAIAMAELGLPEAAQTLLEMTSSAAREVRGASVAALMMLGARQATPRLNAMIEGEKDAWVRGLIVDALRNLGDKTSVVPLITALRNESDMQVKLQIGRALQTLTRQAFGTSYEEWKKWLDTRPNLDPDKVD